ncbi:uncharacterized protein LOC120671414 [Panicum virgatum]|uniref:Uncharacterized protein n=1 Tax=Panicum virgatum TaxID=38727 RepID=A0A8T0T6S7_PANVG|nr:uncharacterized protein LOC120671414 [Panicum virgatum]KAG2604884.1 hypothetical protein PVAP13_4NG110400 [Panicum virgatum]
MAGAVPGIVVLALGAGALGGPDGLRLLLAVAGRNPVADIAICLFALTVATAQIRGAVLLARFVRKAPAGAGADPLALTTLLLSLAAASLVAACLVVAPGGLGSVRLLADSAAKNYPIGALVVIAATAAAYLLRVFRERWNARGRAATAERDATARHAHAERFVGLPLLAVVAAAAAAAVGARGGLDALRLSPGFAVAVTIAIVVGATLRVVLFYRRTRNNAAAVGGGGDAAPAPGAAPLARGASASHPPWPPLLAE